MQLRTLSDRALLRAVAALITRDRATTAELLDHLAEVDARRLYLASGHPSMFAYCTEALHMSESSASKRIRAARAARAYPGLLAAISDGRLHLSAVCVLAPHLRTDNVDELIEAATHLRRDQVEAWLAVRSAPPLVRAAAAAGSHPETTEARLRLPLAAISAPAADAVEHSPGNVDNLATCAGGKIDFASAPAVAPHFVLHVALPPATHAKLQRAQRLLAHSLPAGDVAAVLDRALDALLAQVERRKFAATRKPREPRGPRAAKPRSPRTIPAAVKRAVVARDGERCAYVAPDGRRCSARSRLEFDHLDPVARGGLASADRVRLLCRAHNQFEAERVFRREFMLARRRRAVQAAEARVRMAASAAPHPPD